MENTGLGGIPEMLETAGAVSEEEQMQEPAARKTRRRKTGKNRSGLKGLAGDYGVCRDCGDGVYHSEN